MPGVLKKHLVKPAGTRVLGEAAAGEFVASTAAEGLPQARIVEQANGLVVVEVVCECGRRIYLNCECRPS
jgi:hypothetical protein